MGIVEDRRALHRIPELDRELGETMAYLERALSGLGCRVFSPMAGALAAFFDFGREDTLAFRADCDALPIQEENPVPYRSAHPGKMHACGHDGHMAIVLELARRLSRKKSLPGNVLLVFQPAEETTGGARDLCETGIFEKYAVRAIFGLHLWPGLEAGRVFCRENEMMSRSSQITVDIYGQACHIARPAEGVDATAAAVDFYSRVRRLEEALPERIYRILNFGVFQSGSVCNALSDHARMEGSLRAFQPEVFSALQAGIREAGEAVARERGCRVEIEMSQGYPPVMNPPELYRRAAERVALSPLEAPSMTTEDFSWYQQRLPGLFFFLGLGDVPPLHAPDFDFDERILLKGADLFETLAETFL